MPKKTKKIQKEEKEEKPQASSKKGKKEESSNEWDIFSQGFKGRLNQFISLNKEVLDLKANVEGSDQTEAIDERKNRMASKVEEAAAAILKDELSSLEDWIRDQQNSLKDQIMKIEGAYEDTRKNLLSTGAFTEDEVRDQITAIQKKAAAKKEVYDNYEDLLNRSQSIYS